MTATMIHRQRLAFLLFVRELPLKSVLQLILEILPPERLPTTLVMSKPISHIPQKQILIPTRTSPVFAPLFATTLPAK
jgi:hypothetical protein